MKAFPGHHPLVGTMNTFADGMDLRDYFAAKAMQALIASSKWEGGISSYISDSYKIADAMMKAREK